MSRIASSSVSAGQAGPLLRRVAVICAGLAFPALALGAGNLAGWHTSDLRVLSYYPPAFLVVVVAIIVPAVAVGMKLRNRQSAVRVIGIVGAAWVVSLGVVGGSALQAQRVEARYGVSTLALAGLRGESGRVRLEIRRTTGNSIDLLITSKGFTANAVGAANWTEVHCANADVDVSFQLARDISHGPTSQAIYRYAGGGIQPPTAGSEHHLPYCSFVIEHIGPGQDYFPRYAPMHR